MPPSDSKQQCQGAAKRSKALEWVCENIMPNCGKAMSLVEKGIEQPLSASDKLALKYHGRLCPFCGCNEGKFSSLFERYKEIDTKRVS